MASSGWSTGHTDRGSDGRPSSGGTSSASRASGERFGPYQVIDRLGAGGMGEVYRARDVRLDRTVALKLLPQHLASSPEARRRFEIEARAVSALNHPHICTLFDIGEQDGTQYLVMELVEGETLASRLARGPLPIDQALRCGAQIAGALARAHREAIVHRDLKPGNVMLSKSGGIKLLDFGLAGLTRRPLEGLPSPAVSATEALPLTVEGTILGTVHYMAPEQLEGKRVDARADLFAFGAVLYEMLTGCRAFDGDTVMSVVSAILRDQPRPVRDQVPLVPPALARLLDACLAKDPQERWQSALDLEVALTDLVGTTETAAKSAPTSRRRDLWLAAALAAAATGLAAGWWLRPTTPASTAPVVRLSVPPPPERKFFQWIEGVTMAVSPDGRRLAMIGHALDTNGVEVWIRELDDRTPRRLAGSEGANSLFWSPDGRFLGLFGQGRLRKLEAEGGTAVVLAEMPKWVGLAGTWGRDRIVFASIQGDGLYELSVEGGSEPRLMRAADVEHGEARVNWPCFLADGTSLLYLSVRTDGSSHLILDDGETAPRSLGPIPTRVELVAPDTLAFARDGALLAQRFDAAAARLVGSPMPLAASVRVSATVRFAGFAASRTGTVAVASAADRWRLVWLDADGEESPSLFRGELNSVALSPDGSHALVSQMVPGSGDFSLWELDLERGLATRVTSEAGAEVFGLYLPGGRRIVYSASRDGNAPQLYLRDLASASERKLSSDTAFQLGDAVSADGVWLVFRQRSPQGWFTLARLRIDGDGVPEPLLPPEIAVHDASLSPDSRFLAYITHESGDFEAYVMPFGRPATAVRVSDKGALQVGFAPKTAGTGSEILYLGSDSRFLYAATLETSPHLDVTSVRTVLEAGGLGMSDFEVAPDGRILAMIGEVHRSDEPIELIVGWQPPGR